MIMNGAEALIKALVDNEVDTIFGYPGGAVLPVYDAIFKNKQQSMLLRVTQGQLEKLAVF